MTFSTILKKPSAFLPLAMSIAALALVLGYLAVYGFNAPPALDATGRPDEGTAAHLWQLLMAGQLPIILFFAVKWLPETPVPAVQVLMLQLLAGVAAATPVFLLEM